MNLEMPDGRNELERRFLAEFNARWGVVDLDPDDPDGYVLGPPDRVVRIHPR